MDAKTAQSVFGGGSTTKKRTSKEEINYKSTNESLVKKNLLYKQQLTQCTKTIEKLRDEISQLRQKNQELTDATDEQKIELIVEQRVQNKLSHAAALNKKIVRFLEQTGSEMCHLFKDVEVEPKSLVSRRAPKAETNLDRLDESPIRRTSHRLDGVENEVPAEFPTFSARSSAATSATPRMKSGGGRGRRSELFQDISFNESSTNQSSVPEKQSRRAPMIILPASTPGVPVRKPAPSSASKVRKDTVQNFKKPATPVPAGRSDTSELTDTVRRQRSAKMNIKTLKEPSLGQKLRRPGKHDEPMPYIDTFF